MQNLSCLIIIIIIIIIVIIIIIIDHYYSQTVPVGKPKLVCLSLARLNLEALRRDFPKYHQNMPETASDA
jgi:hypothetical protein